MISARPKGYRSARTDAGARAVLEGRRAPLGPPPARKVSSPADSAGLVMRWGAFETPFGEAIAFGTDAGLCALGFTAETGPDAAFADLASRFPRARLSEDPGLLRAWVAEPDGAPLCLVGAPFQRAVWQALIRIRAGTLVTYSDIAAAIGRPSAYRAVATAVGLNPVSWHVPCHRVIRGDGALGGYHWGLSVKRAMLAHEAPGPAR